MKIRVRAVISRINLSHLSNVPHLNLFEDVLEILFDPLVGGDEQGEAVLLVTFERL